MVVPIFAVGRHKLFYLLTSSLIGLLCNAYEATQTTEIAEMIHGRMTYSSLYERKYTRSHW